MDTIREFLSLFICTSRDTEAMREEKKKKKQTLRLIRKYSIPFMITDRQSGESLPTTPLSKYNEAKHELVVDAYEFMNVMNA